MASCIFFCRCCEGRRSRTLIRDQWCSTFFLAAEPFENFLSFGETYTFKIVIFVAFSGIQVENWRNLYWFPRNTGWKTLHKTISVSSHALTLLSAPKCQQDESKSNGEASARKIVTMQEITLDTQLWKRSNSNGVF